MCYEIVTELQDCYEHIQRIYVRAEHEFISKSYTEILLTHYEDTFYPSQVREAGSLSYIKRNQAMIDMSQVLIVYYNQDYTPKTRTNSGTKLAVEYARKSNKRIINLFE